MTTNTNITESKLIALRAEARNAGDSEQAAIVDRALDGDDAALAECARVIAEAAAQDDDAD